LISPVAIASLPMWSAIGAAVAAVAQPAGSPKAAAIDDNSPADIGDAVRAAVLFAILLELQGRDEAAITRILDRVIDESSDPLLTSTREMDVWLDDIRHRFDTALARESAA
jgi:hypothetical protein